MSYLLRQSQTTRPLLFLLVDSTDHVTGKTGLTPTVTISKNGAAFAAPAGAVTEVGSGWYKCAGNATDTGTLGPLLLHATGTAADPTDVQYEVVAFDPEDAVRIGMTALPNVASGADGSVMVRGATQQIALQALTISAAGTGLNGLSVTGGTNVAGVVFAGAGSGDAFQLSPGATGNGVTFNGGATSGSAMRLLTFAGDALVVTPTAGHGINVTANGTSKHGVFVTGGTAGTSDGIKAVAGTGGVPIRGAVESVTGKVTPIDVDGITFASALEALLAVLSGVATVSGSDVSFKKRDGTTSKITVTVGGTPGARTASVINS